MEKIEHLDPILNSTVNVFKNFLNFEIKEKSLVSKKVLVPKFDISAFLDIYESDVEGKVVLNITKKLALEIYSTLVGETVNEVTDNVLDAVGEIINIITGNAKNEFQAKGLVYKLSTPFIVNGKEQIIKNTSAIPFLSTMYWTSSGFFELSFSLYQKT